MLLRSSSTPIILSPESEYHGLQRTCSISLPISFHSPACLLESNPAKTRKPVNKQQLIVEKEGKPLSDFSSMSDLSSMSSVESVFSFSGLGEDVKERNEEEFGGQTLVGYSDGGSHGGGGGCCGGGSGFFERSNNSHGSGDSTDLYYQNMIEANPGNSLLLGNYAMFLKEVKGDFVKAEEYCGRGILTNPSDGKLLSLYADLIWLNQKDAQRAETYFDRAIKTRPDDCYVLASYAKFLWEADEDENEDGEKQEEDIIDVDHKFEVFPLYDQNISKQSFRAAQITTM